MNIRDIEHKFYDKVLDVLIWVAKLWLIIALASNFVCVDRKSAEEEGYRQDE